MIPRFYVHQRVRHRRTGWRGTVLEIVGDHVYRVRWDVTGNVGLPLSGAMLELEEIHCAHD